MEFLNPLLPATANAAVIFRMLAMALLVAMKLIRWRTHRRTDQKEQRVFLKKNLVDTLLLFPVTLLIQLSIVVYAVLPFLVSWADLKLPLWLRSLGVALSIAALGLLAWADHALGKNFSVTLRIRQDHTLVTCGPYRWIRHPIYTAGLLFGAGVFLVSANWAVGLSWIGGCGLLYAYRIPREEALMLKQFGDEYGKYMERTGRLVPRFFR